MQSKSAWVVVLTAALFFFYEFIQLNLFNAINVLLMQDFHLNAFELAQLASMWFYGNTLFILLAGYWLDRYSTKKIILIVTGLCTAGTFIFAYTHQYIIAAFARFLIGCCAAFGFLGCIRLTSRWFHAKQMATVIGVVVTVAMLGGLVAQTPFALLTKLVGHWRTAVLLNGCLGLVIFIAIACLVKDRPLSTISSSTTGTTINPPETTIIIPHLWQSIKLVAANPQNWLSGLYTALMNLPVFILGGLWGIHYFVVVRHLTSLQASYVTTTFFIGILLGSPLFGLFSDYIHRRVLPMVIGTLLSLVAILLMIYSAHLSFTLIVTLCFIIGFSSGAQVLSYPIIAELNPHHLTSTATSIASLVIMSSGFICLPLFGLLLQYHKSSGASLNVYNYSPHDFNTAMLIIPIAFLSSLVLTKFIKETYCSPLQDC